MNVTVRQQMWCDEAERSISRALGPSILACVANEVRAGISKLWRCESPGHTAWCVTRVDENPRELVIVAFAGSGMHAFAKFFLDAARVQGVPVRAHVASPIVERLIRRFGFKTQERVMRAA